MRRRDLILGAAAVGALGLAEYLRPREKLKLLRTGTIAEAIPETFGTWEARTSELINPEQAGRLARSLYSETIMRTYLDPQSGAEVMILAAYGDTQSDLLQLHRPESCYPAVGFTLRSTKSVDLPLAPQAILPARRVVAAIQDRVENIFYWTRMGERLPRTGPEQREARLGNAMKGYVADGILVRCSVLGDSGPAFEVLDGFVPQMLRAVQPALRPALIGTALAQRIT
jgi:EpsI family protein